MTATVPTTAAVSARPPHILPVARDLAVSEALRFVRHPLTLLAAVLFCAMIVVSSGEGPGSGYDGLVTGPTFFLGVFSYFAANLAATRPHRSAALDEHASFPAPAVARTAGLCLAALGPALLAAALMTAVMAWYAAGRVDLPVWPSAGELAAGPLTVLGGALLGVMVARWLPFPTASALVMVAVVTVTFVLNNGWGGRYALLSPYVTFSVFVGDGSWGGRTPGSAAWHAVYLAALCAMAAIGALLRDVRRRSPLLVLGAGATAVAVLSGWAQLP